MAVSSSLVAPIILLLIISTTTPAVQSARDPAPAPAPAPTNNVHIVCNEASNPEICFKVLSTYPESKMASVRQLAMLSVQAASKMTMEVAAFAKPKVDAMKEPSPCLKCWVADINKAATITARLPAEMTDTMLNRLERSLYDFEDKCVEDCPDMPSPDEDVILQKVTDLHNVMTVALDLITRLQETGELVVNDELEPSSAESPSV